MSKQLTKDEIMAYELVGRMALSADGHIDYSPYWHGWALREAYLEGCKSGRGDYQALEQVIANYREIETGLIELKQRQEAMLDDCVLKASYDELNEKRLQLGRDYSDKMEMLEKVLTKAAEIKQTNTNLKDIIKSLLSIFDRDLPPNSIGRKRCDEAIELSTGVS